MVTALLIVIYIAFIGLGLPHSLFGAAWPAIQADFALPIDSANYVTVLISAFTVVSSMFGSRVVNKFGTRVVITVCTIMAALSLLGFSLSGGILAMCFFAIPLGLSSGATDAALNNYISLHYKAMHMNFMHCFYGIGIMTGPYIMSIMLQNSGWRVGYRIIFMIQCLIALVIIATLPMWKKVKHGNKNSTEQETVVAKNLSYIAMAKDSAIRLDWFMCVAINAIEGVVGIWGSSYLVHVHNFNEAAAAAAIIAFYIGIASGRFLSGLLSNKVSSWKIIKIFTGVMLFGTAVMFVPTPSVAVVGLFLVGLGNGPVYPSIMYLTPKHFGEEFSSSVLGSQMAAAYFGILIGPPIFGTLANVISPSVFPLYILIWDAVFSVAALWFLRKKKM